MQTRRTGKLGAGRFAPLGAALLAAMLLAPSTARADSLDRDHADGLKAAEDAADAAKEAKHDAHDLNEKAMLQQLLTFAADAKLSLAGIVTQLTNRFAEIQTKLGTSNGLWGSSLSAQSDNIASMVNSLSANVGSAADLATGSSLFSQTKSNNAKIGLVATKAETISTAVAGIQTRRADALVKDSLLGLAATGSLATDQITSAFRAEAATLVAQEIASFSAVVGLSDLAAMSRLAAANELHARATCLQTPLQDALVSLAKAELLVAEAPVKSNAIKVSRTDPVALTPGASVQIAGAYDPAVAALFVTLQSADLANGLVTYDLSVVTSDPLGGQVTYGVTIQDAPFRAPIVISGLKTADTLNPVPLNGCDKPFFVPFVVQVIEGPPASLGGVSPLNATASALDVTALGGTPQQGTVQLRNPGAGDQQPPVARKQP